nr:cytochrome c oxidase subunit 3 [Degeeriella rufa]
MWKKGFHSFNMVDISPWPLLGSLSAWVLALGLVSFFWGQGVFLSLFGVCLLSIVSIQWWRDVIREGTYCGLHTSSVCKSLYLGVIMFIASEVMFFFSFFFGFFFVSLSPDVGLYCSWPPMGIEPLSCFSVPLFNTLLLLSSGVSITWAHHAIMSGKLREGIVGLVTTIILGVVFLYVQLKEYFETMFCLMDSVFGSLFFLMTGFHGLHVLVGLLFIIVSAWRMSAFHFSLEHNVGFEVCAWYWHFVDVVWLFLFVVVYWWGG